MKMIVACCLTFLFVSCLNTSPNDAQTAALKQRITLLEQRIDSLISTNSSSNRITKTGSNGISYSAVRMTNRCLAITKKGTQCKRTAKNNYCWQHGG